MMASEKREVAVEKETGRIEAVSDSPSLPCSTPAPTAIACAVYAGIFVVINVAYNLLWWSAAHDRRLLNPNVTPIQVRMLTRNFLLGLPTYLLATLLAFWNLYVSIGICCGLWIFWALMSYSHSPDQRGIGGEQEVETAPGRAS